MARRQKPMAVVTVMMILALLVAGCSKPAETPAPPPPAAEQPAQPAEATPEPAPEPKPPVKLVIITSQSGGFEAWGMDMIQGFEIGLDYATGGSREVAGRKLEVIVKDDQGKPDVGVLMATEAFEKDQADILFGNVNSAITLAIMPLLEQYQRVMIVEPAASPDITGSAFTRYAFRTGSSAIQDALAGAKAAAGMGHNVMQIAPDYNWGHTSAGAWEGLMAAAGASVENLFAPQDTSDFLPYLKQIEQKKPEVLVVHWAGANGVKLFQQIGQLGLYDKIRVTGGIADFATMQLMGADAAGMAGMVKYYHTLPQNPANDFLVAEHKKRYGDAPDLFTGGGFNAAVAAVEALKKTAGNTDAEALIAALEGMTFTGVKGPMTFRKEDHQALQTMYVVDMKMNAGYDFPTPSLIKELSPEETAPPVSVGQ